MSYPGTQVLTDSLKHERRATVQIGWGDLADLIVRAAKSKAGFPDDGVKAVLKIEQLSEGSPAYHVSRWQAGVELVLDLRAAERAPEA